MKQRCFCLCVDESLILMFIVPAEYPRPATVTMVVSPLRAQVSGGDIIARGGVEGRKG